MADAGAPEPRQSRGLIVSRGATLTISGIQLSVGPDGVSASTPTITIALDVTSHWLDLAVSHCRIGADQHRQLIEATDAGQDELSHAAMEGEFKASMEAIAAAAFALDAFYAAVKERIALPEHLSTAWRKNKTSRYRQIAEVFRRGFGLNQRAFEQTTDGLSQVFRFRDWAVHPPIKAQQPAYHDQINASTEWRFVAFRSANALSAAAVSISLVSQLLARPKPGYEALVKYCEPALRNVQPIVDQWTSAYPELLKLSSMRSAV